MSTVLEIKEKELITISTRLKENYLKIIGTELTPEQIETYWSNISQNTIDILKWSATSVNGQKWVNNPRLCWKIYQIIEDLKKLDECVYLLLNKDSLCQYFVKEKKWCNYLNEECDVYKKDNCALRKKPKPNSNNIDEYCEQMDKNIKKGLFFLNINKQTKKLR